MAQLRDTVVQGSLRVTDTIFSTNLNLSSLTASYAVVTDGSKNLISRAITNNTSASAITASTNLITANTLAYWNGAYSGTSSRLTTLGTVSTGTWNATTIGVGYGGTGTQTAPTQGGVIFGSSTSAYGCTSAGTSGQLLQSAGTGTPTWITATDSNTASTIVKRNANGNFTAGTITADLVGTADYAHSLWQRYDIAKGTNPTDSTLWLSNWFNYQTGTTFNVADRIGGGIYSWIATNGDSGLGLAAYKHVASSTDTGRIEIISQPSSIPYISITGKLIVQPQDTAHEGGEIQLVKGPSDSYQCYLDTAYNVFRVHNGTYVPLQIPLVAGGYAVLNNSALWIQAGSEAGSNTNRLTTTSGMPGNMQYNQSRRGTQIYANGIAFCDPYNGNSNSDASWIRHQETTGNSGELEIAVGDDGNEPIVVRQYKTDNTVNRTLTLLGASGQTILTGSLYLPAAQTIQMYYSTQYYSIINSFNNGNIGVHATGADLYLGYYNTSWVRIQKNTNASGNSLGHGIGFWEDTEGGNIRIYSGNCGTYGSYYWEMDAYNGNLRFYNVNSAGTYKGEITMKKDNVMVTNAQWNDYAECRQTEILEAGRVVTESANGIMKKASERLLPGCKIISDTYGHLIGQSKKNNTPIAVSGRVLVYPYQDRDKYELGAALCSAPNGTADIMTREEVMKYPERIIGTVSEIPDYEDWYSSENIDEESVPIKVNGRIWIYVR